MGRYGPAIFVGDASGLDFLNSVATPADTTVDWLDDGEALLAWLEQAQLVPADVLRKIRTKAPAAELDRIANEARSLREWFRGFVLQHKGRPLVVTGPAELEPLNRLLGRDQAHYRLVLRPGGKPAALELQIMRRWRSPQALLLPLGEALARFLSTADFTHVKACERPGCTLLFADRTRGHVRRWCSMAFCGNRMKQAQHRRRVKAVQGRK